MNAFINIFHLHHVCRRDTKATEKRYGKDIQSQAHDVDPQTTASTQTLEYPTPSRSDVTVYIPSDLRSVKCRPRFHSFPDAQGFTDTTPKGLGFNTRERERERESKKIFVVHWTDTKRMNRVWYSNRTYFRRYEAPNSVYERTCRRGHNPA